MWLTPDQQSLRDLMSDISEEGWSAEWMYGLEYSLWHILLNGPAKYGRTFVDKHLIQRLKELSERTGGWIRFDDETEETAVYLDDWQQLFQAANFDEYWS